ncbi:MAG: nucleotidyl transferase AbiEii/AbiGii toxin family protein [Candidatus Thermoplasmatota archaeon]|nr:nucleotidyl transferase AbiEii/AbiGii toxin family protein [Euryarchaeota archaeon]MBU4031998.1 nucleotidyl transferase AbiEii/AbiGii toxin family protein [Candidatus Thermoplasmatota archaeon]MBU4071607.1 nucleotidyl transferase AbiEii/AbiGii toxin family protein [Candidatus Thermoplasmatota archaeon]MBU4144376.1 nucleotidyl transferase AbiEii/AbiGii toxin family protein [Candidatus Thermoplasmatota archaeon]MBU4592774.1 nucleotidyl transferase AbiEii/AbiGii toxin family protein [Candidatus
MLEDADLDWAMKMHGYNRGQAEKDYLQHIVLLAQYATTKSELVFKGGTCLQKVYGLDRFSEDLDYTVQAPTDIEKIIDAIERRLVGFGYPARKPKIEEDQAGIKVRLKIQGPFYKGTDLSLCSLRLEMSKREQVLLPTEVKRVMPPYENLPPYTVLAMSREEIAAEKVRAILTRDKARDLFDMFHLIEKGVRADPKTIDKKLEYYSLRYSQQDFEISVAAKRKIWKAELGPLVRNLPNFVDVEEIVNAALRKAVPS